MGSLAANLPFSLINAFVTNTSSPHSGNPAAIVLLPSKDHPRAADESWMKLVARDFNLSETAYLVPLGENDDAEVLEFGLRWFTPANEVDLCGHATLASSQFLFSRYPTAQTLHFHTQVSGILIAEKRTITTKAGGETSGIVISVPAIHAEPEDSIANTKQTELSQATSKALGIPAGDVIRVTALVKQDRSVIVEVRDSVDIAAIQPDILSVGRISPGLFIVSQINGPNNITSRIFAPGHGVNEDPVCGSAHAALLPYYLSSKAFVNGRDPFSIEFTCSQPSPRGGTLYCKLLDVGGKKRVELVGQAVEYARGELTL